MSVGSGATRHAVFMVLGCGLLILGAASSQPSSPVDKGLPALPASAVQDLLRQGELVLVARQADGTLREVTAGVLVDAPVDRVWQTITDFEHYPSFMPQNTEAKVLDGSPAGTVRVQQTVAMRVWRLPAIEVHYTLAHRLDPPTRVSFWQVDGELPGTRGRWELVAAGPRTLCFYTTYTDLTQLGWGLGSMFRDEPEFMTGVTITTAMMVARATRDEVQRRVRAPQR
ncbi:MAG: SRPBCC family protein [Pseudomonadota bacterium]